MRLAKCARDCSKYLISTWECKKTVGNTFGRWERQNAHETDSETSISTWESDKKTDHFWKMRLEKCARDCSESSVSTWKCLKKLRVREHFWKMRSAKRNIPGFKIVQKISEHAETIQIRCNCKFARWHQIKPNIREWYLECVKMSI